VKGLRAHLCLWHAGLMALTLLLLAGFTYALLGGVLHSRADAALTELADTTARQIAIALYSQPRAASERRYPAFLSDDLRNWGRYIQLVDPQSHILEKSDGLDTHPLPVSARALRRGLEGRTTLETFPGLGEHPVRVATVPVQMGSRVPLMVQAGTSLEGVEAALQRTGWILVVLTPLVFLLALVGNYIVVGRTLGRVDLLTQTALEIQHSNLQRRIRHTGPQDEIGRLASAFDEMIARLDQSFQQVRRFSADASHELKTPLTAIRAEAELGLMADMSPEGYRQSLTSVLESAERMSEIVESLLLLARADAGQQLLRRETVDLAELTLETVDRLTGMAERHGVRVEMVESGEAMTEGDPLWIGQIASNLISNAVKYTPREGRVEVRVRPSDGWAELMVRDTGIGIAADDLPHIFDRFYRVDKGRARATGGTGLGLSITRWATEAHGGEIAVQSTPGEGSVFTVRFPSVGS